MCGTVPIDFAERLAYSLDLRATVGSLKRYSKRAFRVPLLDGGGMRFRIELTATLRLSFSGLEAIRV
jgi:hypothetical protein